MQRVGRTKSWAAVMKHVAPPVDRVLHRVSGGRFNMAGIAIPTFMLIHRGAKSGKTYRTPLSYITAGDAFVLAGSNFGQAHHPAWTANLLAHPEVFVEVKGERIPVRARRASETEKAELWPRFVEMWPAYGEYEIRSGDRNIRLFVLERR